MPEETDKRQRILHAAIRVFARKGFFGSRVSDIAKDAGVADGTIYLYFKSKDDLLISVFEDKMDEILPAFRTAMEQVADPLGKIRAFIRTHGELVRNDPELAQVLQVELRQSSKFMKEYKPVKFNQLLELLAEAVEEGQKLGIIRPDVQPATVKRAVFGSLDELALHWVSRPNGFDLEAAYNQLADILCAGLSAVHVQAHV